MSTVLLLNACKWYPDSEPRRIDKEESFRITVKKLRNQKGHLKINDSIYMWGGFFYRGNDKPLPDYIIEYHKRNNLFPRTINPQTVRLEAVEKVPYTLEKLGGQNKLRVIYREDTLYFETESREFIIRRIIEEE